MGAGWPAGVLRAGRSLVEGSQERAIAPGERAGKARGAPEASVGAKARTPAKSARIHRAGPGRGFCEIAKSTA